ncbi:MFS transporter [Thozetella sp. PMI_491]|nr:MFS transporter [Thozetella sp. PMI_491]
MSDHSEKKDASNQLDIEARSAYPDHVAEEDGDVKLVDVKGADEAAPYATGHGIQLDEETSKRLLRKIDWNMMPLMCILYMLQYLDKVLLSYSAVMGILKDTGMNTAQYSWAGSIFYIGYLAFEYPHNRLMQRLPIAKYMSVMVMAWGVVLCLTALVHNVAGVMVTRFLLGAGEGAITAGFVLITSQWYTASEQVFRSGIWFSFNGTAQIVGGAIAYGVSRGLKTHPIAIASWKFLFIIIGAVTALYGIIMWLFLADSPIKAKWLSEEEKRMAIERIRHNQQGIGSRVFKWYQVREVLTDVRTWLNAFCIITINIPNGGLTVFFTLMITSYGFDSETSFLLSMPAGFTEIITMLLIPYLAMRYGNRTLWAALSMIIGLLGIALMAGLGRENPTGGRIGQLVGYYLQIAAPSTALLIALSTVGTNTAGYTKKTTANAVQLIAYCVGFLIGPQTFRDGPYYYNAKYVIIVMWFLSLCCFIVMYFLNRYENRRRDKLWEEAGCPPQPVGQEFMDLTDKENPYFRYAL